MEELLDVFDEDYVLNTSVISNASTSTQDEQPGSVSKQKKSDDNCVPWRFCLSKLQHCKDPKNRAQFKKLISKYSQVHFQQRKVDALAKGRIIWTDFENRYGADPGENWLRVEADIIAREEPFYSFVNILIKADPSTGAPCRAIKRVNGICRSHPEHTVKELRDPRSQQKRLPKPTPLIIPKYQMDDYIDFAPPRREIAFIELNDNVKHDYLHEFCCGRGKRELAYLQIYTHPTNGSHLGMALAEFKTTAQAMEFYTQCGPSPKIMGFGSRIFVDTLGFWITDEYRRLTGTDPPAPPRRSFFQDEDQIARIRGLIRLQNVKDGVLDSQESSDAIEKDELDVTKPSGARTPVGEMPNSSSVSVDSSISRSASCESILPLDDDTIQKNGRSPSESNSTSNEHSQRRRSRSRSRSRSSRDYRNHNGRSNSRYRDEFDYRDRSYREKRRRDSREDRRPSKYRRRDQSISPDRTKSSYRSNRKRSVSSSSTRSGSSSSYRRRSKRAYRERTPSPQPIRQNESRNEKVSEVAHHPPEAINLSVHPPLAPYDLSLPFITSCPPPSLFTLKCSPPPIEPPSTLKGDVPVRITNVEREVGPYFLLDKTQRVDFFKQMREYGYYNETGVFVIPTLRLYEDSTMCSFIVTDFFVEVDHANDPSCVNPQLKQIEKIKDQLQNDLLNSLKASMCQKIQALMHKEVERLHAEYEIKQKLLNEEKSKVKRPEAKQMFDFEAQFNNTTGMGTRSIFGSNKMWQLNRNILSTKKIPKKSTDISVNHKRSADIKHQSRKPRHGSRSTSPTAHSTSQVSNSPRKSPRTPTASPISSSSSSLSGGDISDSSNNENVRKKKKVIGSASASAISSSSASRTTSPKPTKTEEDNEMEDLQITQSRTLRKVDYCEDDSTSEEEGDSDWAEQFGIGDEVKERKRAIKKTKLQRKKSPDKAIADSDQEETKPKERPKKKKPPISSKPIVIKVESLNLDDIGAHSSTISTVEMGVPPPKTPPIDYGDEDKLPYAEESDTPPPNAEPSISNIVIPQTIKIEPPIETLVGSLQRDVQTVLVERPKTVLVEKPVVKQRAPKPKLYKPKPIELPQEHVQRFPNVRFQPRTNEEDMRFLFDFADEEDSCFIMTAVKNKKVSISQLSINEQIRRPVLFHNPFAANLDSAPVLPSPKTSKGGGLQRRTSIYLDSYCVGSKEGAARLIPYERGRPKLMDKLSSINYGYIEVTKKDERAARNKQEKRRELRALQRNLVSTVGDCSIVRQNVFKFREKMLKFARSSIHGWGLFTLEDIQPNDMIIEYVGEVIRPTIADVREFNYTRRGIGSSYLFRMDDDSVVDATNKGNVARFINHSCNPNCFARVIGKAEQQSICIYAKRFIGKGEEITYDYQFPIEDNKIPCHCGAVGCRLYLN